MREEEEEGEGGGRRRKNEEEKEEEYTGFLTTHTQRFLWPEPHFFSYKKLTYKKTKAQKSKFEEIVKKFD